MNTIWTETELPRGWSEKRQRKFFIHRLHGIERKTTSKILMWRLGVWVLSVKLFCHCYVPYIKFWLCRPVSQLTLLLLVQTLRSSQNINQRSSKTLRTVFPPNILESAEGHHKWLGMCHEGNNNFEDPIFKINILWLDPPKCSFEKKQKNKKPVALSSLAFLSIALQLLLSFLYFLPSSSLLLASFSFPPSTCAHPLQLPFLWELVLSVGRLKELSLFSTKSHCQEHNFLQQTFDSSHMLFAHSFPPSLLHISCWMQWLIQCANVTRSQMPDIGPGIILGVSVRVFPNDLTAWKSRLRRTDYPPQCRCASSN